MAIRLSRIGGSAATAASRVRAGSPSRATLRPQNATGGDAAVVPLSRFRPGEHGRIAYVETSEPRRLQKLLALGVLPGKELYLRQAFPGRVFQVGHSQFAIDDDLARAIFVRREA
ncbi:MAG: ferrous iron transport protein A [Chloroflexi bacterium]|nr:ferrous iron transport protein A [Chloroflexota bacterium]